MKISIVTPSYNQAAYLRKTLESIHSQEINDLEHIVIDGGSTDGSVEIIKEYSTRLAYWCSEPDGGHYQAINKGFSKSTGEIMGWLNSSDLYLPWSLRTVEDIFNTYPQVMWVSALQKICITEDGAYGCWPVDGFSSRRFFFGQLGSRTNSNFIQQETCFWRRSLWDMIGSKITDDYRYAADFWLWSQFFIHARCTGVDAPLAVFRFHGDQRSSDKGYRDEVAQILERLDHSQMVSGVQNVDREWVPTSSGNGGRCIWNLAVHDDDYFDLLSCVSQILENLKWKLTKLLFFIQSGFKFLLKLL